MAQHETTSLDLLQLGAQNVPSLPVCPLFSDMYPILQLHHAPRALSYWQLWL